ncbi:MAG: GntR family transcriptional regulator [Microbacteriaceae bacterium]
MPDSAKTPGVDRAYRGVLERLRSGEFPPGSRLPGERSLALELGVSRETLRASLALLASEHWIDSSYKRGWFVRHDAVSEPPNTLLSFTEMAAARGATAQSTVIDAVVRPSTFDEAGDLRMVPSAEVVEISRVRSMDHVPICLDRVVIRHDRVPGIEHLDLEDRSLYALLREQYRLHVTHSSYTVSAELMDERTAMLLDVAAGSAALVAKEITESSGGEPLITSTLVYRGGAYRFKADLFRP